MENCPQILVGNEQYVYYPATGYVQIMSPTTSLLINLRAHSDFVVIGTKIVRKTRAGHSYDFWCANPLDADEIKQFFVQHMTDDESVNEFVLIAYAHDSKCVTTTAIGEKNAVFTCYESKALAQDMWNNYKLDVE